MSHTISWPVRLVGVAVATIGLAATGLVLTAGGSAGAGSTVPPLDHFLCYSAKAAGFTANPNLLLSNQLQPGPFAPAVGKVNIHCNPANKSIPGAIFPSKDPLAHLLCMEIKAQWHTVNVEVANQFGKAELTTAAIPTELCLPSWKSNLAPPDLAVTAPPGLDHFTCYPVVPTTSTAYGFRFPAGMKAEDEFSAPKYTPIKLGVSNLLCVPTTKIVAGVQYPPQTPNDLSLTCFPSSPTPIWKLVYDENQFGTGPVAPSTTNEEFCAPSTVSIITAAG